MKKFLLILTVTVVALCLAAPAMAGLKLTTKGYMDVTGININNNIIDRGVGAGNTNDSANSWYQMEMIVDTTLHINDKVRIHGQFTVLERNWTGGDVNAGVVEGFADYRGTTDFYWERLYLSFPLFGGTLYVGRMGGGGWAYPFQDAKDNRDRIKYVRKFGHILVVGVIEKLAEIDGGTFLTAAPAAGDGFDTSHSDVNSYAVGSIIPFSKNIIWKPLFYYIDRQTAGGLADDGYSAIFMNALMVKAGPFKLDFEVNYRWTDRSDFAINGVTGLAEDWDEGQWSYWIDAGVTFGPAEIALGSFFLEGTDSVLAWENNTLWGIGAEFQPLLLLTSEDCGLVWNAGGVPNGSAGLSGFEAYYLRFGYKISDSMKLRAILAYVEADEMMSAGASGGFAWAGSHWDGVRAADDELGWEFDISFEWKFMPNIKYVAEFAYLDAGDYWSTFGFAGNGPGTDVANDVWGMRHMLVINW